MSLNTLVEPSSIGKRLVPAALITYFVVSIIVAWTSSGTYDAGDSVMHYQFAHYAFEHPRNLLVHWAKPFFTLVATPFAMVGFAGIKLFQCLLVVATGWMNIGIGRRLGLRHAWTAALFTLMAPELFLVQLSGLTEPFFAFMLTLGVYLVVRQKAAWACLALSFLPFVRTEGFLLLPIFGAYLILAGKWKAMPLLAVGTVVYSVIGGFVLGDFLWIWTLNPYAGASPQYGRGGILDYPGQYYFVTGLPIYVLTGLGLVLAPMWGFFRSKGRRFADWLLLAGPFIVYFGAHVYFWASGTGHSMGLMRVMIAIVPAGGLIAAVGLGFALERLSRVSRPAKTAILTLIACYILAFPWIPHPAAFHLHEFRLTADQDMLNKTHEWIMENNLQERKIYAAHPSAAYFLGFDPFDQSHSGTLAHFEDQKPAKGDLILLDSWFARVEYGLTQADFDSKPTIYRLLKAWPGIDGAKPITISLYERI